MLRILFKVVFFRIRFSSYVTKVKKNVFDRTNLEHVRKEFPDFKATVSFVKTVWAALFGATLNLVTHIGLP